MPEERPALSNTSVEPSGALLSSLAGLFAEAVRYAALAFLMLIALDVWAASSAEACGRTVVPECYPWSAGAAAEHGWPYYSKAHYLLASGTSLLAGAVGWVLAFRRRPSSPRYWLAFTGPVLIFLVGALA